MVDAVDDRMEAAHLVSVALSPLRFIGDDVHARTTAYVLTGENPEVLADIEENATEVNELLGPPASKYPMRLETRYRQRLEELGVLPPGLSIGWRNPVWSLRDPLYRSLKVSSSQWVRLSMVLERARIGHWNKYKPSTAAPPWFDTFLADMMQTVKGVGNAERPEEQKITEARPIWTPERCIDVLVAGGVSASQAAAVLFTAIFAGTPYASSLVVKNGYLPGLREFLIERGSEIPASVTKSLGQDRRGLTMTWLQLNPEVGNALIHVVAAAAVDPGRIARDSAIRALGVLDPQLRNAAIVGVMERMPLADATELLEYVTTLPEGRAMLAEASAKNKRLAAHLNAASELRAILASTGPDRPATPPIQPYPLDQSAAGAKPELGQHFPDIADADLDALITAAEGRSHSLSEALRALDLGWIAYFAPSLGLAHLLRLEALMPERIGPSIARLRLRYDSDPRALWDLLQRLGSNNKFLVDVMAYATTDPESAWKWFAEHPEHLCQRMKEPRMMGHVVEITNQFPQIPHLVAEALVDVALGPAKTSRSLAQAALVRHPAVRRLAEWGLSSPSLEKRIAAAEWLASLKDPAAIPALEHVLAREKRERARQAIETAIQALSPTSPVRPRRCGL